MIEITLDIETALKRASVAARCNYFAPWSVFTKLYSRSTEITEDFLIDFDLKGKRVITVGSSGDQVLTYAYLDCKDITLMDANPLTPFFVNLKIAALKTLTREEFIAFFQQDIFNKENNEDFMNMRLYGKIRSELDEKTQVFWDKLYDDEMQERIFHIYSGVNANSNPPYLTSDEKYEELKSKIDEVKVSFHHSDISAFHEHAEGEYELIDLSNIYSYISKEKYWQSVESLYQHLSKEGYLKLHYCNNEDISDFAYLDKKAFSLPVKSVKDAYFIIWQNDEYLYEKNHVNKTY